MSSRDLVFFSYRHGEDERWVKALRSALEPYVLGDKVLTWSDEDIRVGSKWNSEIQGALARTRVGVVLVSQAFFGSEYITTLELPRLISDAERGLIFLVCVVVDAVAKELLTRHKLSEFQFVDKISKPLRARAGFQRTQAIVEVATSVYNAYRASVYESGVNSVTPTSIRSTAPFAQGALSTGAVDVVAELHDVPLLDDRHIVLRNDSRDAMKALLLQGSPSDSGTKSKAHVGIVGVHGMGGTGKTVLAQLLCYDANVRGTFADGIYWIALGQQPDLLALQNRLLRMVEPHSAASESLSQGRERLRQHFLMKRALLVLDDLWNAQHFQPFDVAEGQCRVVITSRDGGALALLGACVHELGQLGSMQSLRLLALCAGVDERCLPADTKQVVEQCAGLPLALKLAGTQVASGVSWGTVRKQLEDGRIRYLDHPYGSVYTSLGHSIDALPESERERYLELAVFPEDTRIPVLTIGRLWQHTGGLEPAQTEKLLAALNLRALLKLGPGGELAAVSFHDLQRDVVQMRAPGPIELSTRLLDAYRSTLQLPVGPVGWARLPRDDPYLWSRLATHLLEAQRGNELRALLLSLDWLQARLAASSRSVEGLVQVDVNAALADYTHLPKAADLVLVGEALQLSAHVLARHPEALGQQIYGRLSNSELSSVRELCAECERRNNERPLLPLRPALDPPGTLKRTLSGHRGPVLGAMLLPDRRRALSWSDDHMLKIWDLERGECLHDLEGHKDTVWDALLLPDGNRALSWSNDGSLRLWDLERAECLHELKGHKASVNFAQLLPDGRRALSWSNDHTLKVWDVDLGKPLHTLAGHQQNVQSARLLLDGRRALSWSQDHTLRVWDLSNGKQLHILEGHNDLVWGALLLPDGRRALSWSIDGTLLLWDLESGEQLKGFEGAGFSAFPLADGQRALFLSAGHALTLWDLERGGRLRDLPGHKDKVNGAILVGDGRRLLSWSEDSSLKLWNLEGEEDYRDLLGHTGPVRGAELTADGRHALSWSWAEDPKIRLWDLERAKSLGEFAGHEDQINGVLPLPDGQSVLSWSDDCTLKLWRAELGIHLERAAGHQGRVNGIALLAGDGQALSWAQDATLKAWSLERGNQLYELRGHKNGISGTLLADGQRALSWSFDELMLWDLSRRKRLRGWVPGGQVEGALLLDDAKRALSWGWSWRERCGGLTVWGLDRRTRLSELAGPKEGRGTVIGAVTSNSFVLSWSAGGAFDLWDLERGMLVHSLAGHSGDVKGALLLGDGQRALSWADDDRTLKLWNLVRGKCFRNLKGHETAVEGALLLPDGRRAMSWAQDGMLKVWDLDHGKALHTLAGHKAAVLDALFLADGRRVLSWSLDRTLKIWDLESGKLLHDLEGHDGPVLGVLPLFDGRRAISCSTDRSIRLWDLESAREIDVYFTDALLSAFAVGLNGTRVLAGDAAGSIHLLRLKAGD